MPSATSFLQQGGTVIWFILLASVIGTAYILYCLLVLRRSVVLSGSLVKVAKELEDSNECAAAEELCRKEGGPFAEILLTVIQTKDVRQEEAEALVEAAGRRAAHELSQGILALEVVAAISPLMGLLGTVIGMYHTFGNIETHGVKEIAQISSGIKSALVTTIAGLVVAIPAFVAYTCFSRRIDDLVLEMERHAATLMVRLRK